MPTLNDVLIAKAKVADLLLRPANDANGSKATPPWLSSNIVGLGPALKVTGGETTADLGLTVYVRSKFHKDLVGTFGVSDMVHHELGDFPTDVVETGALRSLNGPAVRGPVSQVAVGADVSMAGRATHGTLCAFVSLGSSLGLLSSGHVLDGFIGNKLVVSRDEIIAHIWRSPADLLPGTGNGGAHQHDAVIAELASGVTPNLNLPGDLGRLSTAEPLEAVHNMAVRKVGKTVVDGIVTGPHSRITIFYPSQTCQLDNQILVQGLDGTFADQGDSGAMVVAMTSGVAGRRKTVEQIWPVGMVIAAGDPVSLRVNGRQTRSRFAVVSPLADVLAALSTSLYIG